jgi:hypothetical protein
LGRITIGKNCRGRIVWGRLALGKNCPWEELPLRIIVGGRIVWGRIDPGRTDSKLFFALNHILQHIFDFHPFRCYELKVKM